jgi:asparagine synthase (glutamine-hydrolysing)
MCGIIAYVNNKSGISAASFEKMRDTMSHRGPDGKGAQYFEENRVALGHRRLSIVDLTDLSAQPMSDTQQSVWITFNGEIYNFKELKEELCQKYTFKSTGDTEVLIYGYKEWGIDKLLTKLNGMFAFCIWDNYKKKLFVARDRVGIKPVYYYKDEKTFIFSSELKAITAFPQFKKVLSEEGLSSYFSYRYIIAPYTIYKNCFKLKPGHYLTYDFATNNTEETTYWTLNATKTDNEPDIEKLNAILDKAVKFRVETADVPVHTFLSGGIDSSLITAFSKQYNTNLHAYSIEVEDEHKNEIKDAEYVANHLKVALKQEKLNATLFDTMHNEVISKYDEPLADTSCIPTYFLCKLAAKHVKVALSGDGGDELFYGYSWYAKYLEEATTDCSLEKYLSFWLNTLRGDTLNKILPNNKSNEIEKEFLAKLGDETLSPENAHLLDYHTFMVDNILTKVDVASMANSLEVRVPFLDHNLVQAAFSISAAAHFKNNELKYGLKKIAEKKLPKKTIYKKKQGFSVPSVSWISVDYEYNIKEGYASKDGVWNKEAISQLLKTKLHEEQKWLLYNFERWYAIHFHEQKTPLKPHVLKKIKKWMLKK